MLRKRAGVWILARLIPCVVREAAMPEKEVVRSSRSLVVAVVMVAVGGQASAWASGETSDQSARSVIENSGQIAGDNMGTSSLTLCPEPRPEICTREYRPVCAQMHSGGSKTYATGCTACADADVAGYGDGACK